MRRTNIVSDLIIKMFTLTGFIASSLTFLLTPSPLFAEPVTIEAKFDQGEGQLDFITINADIKEFKGKMLFLNSELSNIPDAVVLKAADVKTNKHNLDIYKYQHAESEFQLFKNAQTLSFFSPVMSLQEYKYYFVFIGKVKGSKLHGTLYEYRIDPVGEKYLTEIPIK